MSFYIAAKAAPTEQKSCLLMPHNNEAINSVSTESFPERINQQRRSQPMSGEYTQHSNQ